jgi:hypothetical protein
MAAWNAVSGIELACDPRNVLRRHHVVLRRRPEAARVEALEGAPRFAQPNHLPSGFWRQNAPAAPPSASPDFGQVGTNLWSHEMTDSYPAYDKKPAIL